MHRVRSPGLNSSEVTDNRLLHFPETANVVLEIKQSKV